MDWTSQCAPFACPRTQLVQLAALQPTKLFRGPVSADDAENEGEEEPELVIDFATLTGAAFVTTGFVGGEIANEEDLLVQTPKSLHSRFNLDVRVNSEVVSIDREAKVVNVRELANGREYALPYDALVISTGAAPLLPPIPGIVREIGRAHV